MTKLLVQTWCSIMIKFSVSPSLCLSRMVSIFGIIVLLLSHNYLTWLVSFMQVPPSKTLITPVQCKSLWRQFKAETEYTVSQAIAAQAWYITYWWFCISFLNIDSLTTMKTEVAECWISVCHNILVWLVLRFDSGKPV